MFFAEISVLIVVICMVRTYVHAGTSEMPRHAHCTAFYKVAAAGFIELTADVPGTYVGTCFSNASAQEVSCCIYET